MFSWWPQITTRHNQSISNWFQESKGSSGVLRTSYKMLIVYPKEASCPQLKNVLSYNGV